MTIDYQDYRPLSAHKRVGLLAFVALISFLVVVPLFRLQQVALSEGWGRFWNVFARPTFGSTIWSTVQLALGSLAIAMTCGTVLAVAATRLPRRLAALRVVPILPIIVPAVASVVGWTALLSPRPGYLNSVLRLLPWWSDLDEGPINVYSILMIVVITGIGLTSFVYLFVSAGLANVNSELLEAARTSGSTEIATFFRVTLPILRPVLVYGGGVVVLLALGQFTAPLLLGRTAGVRVITTEMYYYTAESPVDYVGASAIAAPLIMFGAGVVFVQRWVLGDQRRFVTHGGKSFRSQSRPSRFAAALIALYGFVALVLPLIGLFILSVSPFWSADIDAGTWTLDNFRTALGTPGITRAISTSLTCALGGMAIALPLGFVAARILIRSSRFPIARWLTDVVVALPLGVPAVVFGVGFLNAYTNGPFVLYGTRWVIVLVYVTLMLPFSTRMQLSAMLSLGDSYDEASRVSGAGTIRTHVQIVLPLIRGALGGAAALMFVLLTHEFAASLLVRSPVTQVLGTTLFDYWVNGSYPMTAAIAMIMTGITLVGVCVAMVIGGRNVFESL